MATDIKTLYVFKYLKYLTSIDLKFLKVLLTCSILFLNRHELDLIDNYVWQQSNLEKLLNIY